MKNFDIWKEGKYLDLWSVNHFLSGVVFTGWMLFLHFESFTILFSYLFVAIGWEVFEKFRGIHEHMGNRVVDVIVGVLGVFTVYIFAVQGTRMSFQSLIIITLIFLLMELHGFITYRQRKKIK
ncbi:MAG: hypothetical protein ABIR14_00285 [Candidatus Paceibacterota bacterium]